MATTKLEVQLFVSYAHADRTDVDRLYGLLQPYLTNSTRFSFRLWRDGLILPGEGWRAEIDKALSDSACGLLMLSPSFLARPFITSQELAVLMSKKMILPVELQRIPLDGSIELHGLEDRQIFRDSKGRSFDHCRTPPDQRRFAGEFFSQLDAVLSKYAC